MIHLTEAAVQRINHLMSHDGRPLVGLRIQLHQGGCCGTSYHFVLDTPKPGDQVITHDPVRLLLAPDAAPVLTGAKLDYGPRLKPPRFRVLRNPNTPHRCACGRSFGSPYPGRSTPQCQAYLPMEWDR